MFGLFSSKNKDNTSCEPLKKTQTKTGMTASTMKNRKLKTRKELLKLRAKLPKDFRDISEGTFAEMTKITPNLYLTGIFGLTKENFEENKITNVINASYEAPDIQINGITYMRVLVDDDPDEELLPYFDIVSDNIQSEATKGRNTVVHCVAGVSRSTALVLSYLVKYKNMSLKSAFKYTIERRKCIKPISAFIQQLISYEKRLKGRNSFQMIAYKSEGLKVLVPDFWPQEYPQLLNLELEMERERSDESSVD